MATLFGKHS